MDNGAGASLAIAWFWQLLVEWLFLASASIAPWQGKHIVVAQHSQRKV
jgi:hypothetical protein